jgi:hypothetical protein
MTVAVPKSGVSGKPALRVETGTVEGQLLEVRDRSSLGGSGWQTSHEACEESEACCMKLHEIKGLCDDDNARLPLTKELLGGSEERCGHRRRPLSSPSLLRHLARRSR